MTFVIDVLVKNYFYDISKVKYWYGGVSQPEKVALQTITSSN